MNSGPLGWLKFIHVASVIAWVGGAMAMSIFALRLARTERRESLASFLRVVTYFGPRLSGAGSVVAVLSGIGMVIMAHIGFTTLWVALGIAGVIVHFIVGAGLIPRAAAGLLTLAEASGTTDAQIAAARKSFATLTGAYLTLMFVVVLDMVLKPTM